MSEPVPDRVFHELLVACFTQRRRPSDDEVNLIAGKIWHDGYAVPNGRCWSKVTPGSDQHRYMRSAAHMAFGLFERQAA
ncbi:MAG TPA: hypothetical protein VF475_05565 [Sphingobium sp.]